MSRMQTLCFDVRERALQLQSTVTPYNLLVLMADALEPYMDGVSPKQFGPEWRWGHPSLDEGPDLPNIVDTEGWKQPGAPDTWDRACSTGIINIGVSGSSSGNSKHISFKYKYLGGTPAMHDSPFDIGEVMCVGNGAKSLLNMSLDKYLGKAMDICAFFVSVNKTFNIRPCTILDWLSVNLGNNSKRCSPGPVPDVSVVSKTSWFMPWTKEMLLSFVGISESGDEEVHMHSLEIYTFGKDIILPIVPTEGLEKLMVPMGNLFIEALDRYSPISICCEPAYIRMKNTLSQSALSYDLEMLTNISFAVNTLSTISGSSVVIKISKVYGVVFDELKQRQVPPPPMNPQPTMDEWIDQAAMEDVSAYDDFIDQIAPIAANQELLPHDTSHETLWMPSHGSDGGTNTIRLSMELSLDGLGLKDFILSAENSFEIPPPILGFEQQMPLPMPPMSEPMPIPTPLPMMGSGYSFHQQMPMMGSGYSFQHQMPMLMPLPMMGSGYSFQQQMPMPTPLPFVSAFANTSGGKVFPGTMSIRATSGNLTITRSGSIGLCDILFS